MTDWHRTPDFDVWPVDYPAVSLTHTDDTLGIIWSDGATSWFHVLLRENSPDPSTIHPETREMCISPMDIHEDLTINDARIEAGGAVSVAFSDGTKSAFHPGWLRGIAWFGDPPQPARTLWRAEDLPAPPTFDGPEALLNPAVFLDWLEALRDFGVARLRSFPQRDGLLEEIVTRIGPVHESNFSRQYILAIKNAPDSQAFTPDMLPQHIDLPTRETPHGLQFLFTRQNMAKGGEGIYADTYRIAEDMSVEEPEHFRSLTQDCWEYNNRAQHRLSGPRAGGRNR